jgi:hypothetical protein
MVTHMKTTIEISDALLDEAKRCAARRGTTLREVIEAGLRKELKAQPRSEPFKLEDKSFGSGGMAPEFVEGGWAAIRDEIYRGRGT